MSIRDLTAARAELPEIPAVRSYATKPQEKVFVNLGPLNVSTMYLGRWTGQSPWERHPGGEELIHVLEGEVVLTIVSAGKQEDTTVQSNCLFIVPQGVWHRQTSRSGVTAFYATPTPSDFSWTLEPPA
jgi:quercetin dioxygenase-like cupin family protein